MKINLCMQINSKVFYKLILSFFVAMVRHTQKANLIAEFLKGKYPMKNFMDCPDFLHK